MRADTHVVRNLYLVIQLHVFFDHGIVQRTAVYGRIGTDLDMVANDHAPDLRDLQPFSLFPRHAKTVGADHHTGMGNDVIADDACVIHRHSGIEQSIFAQDCILSDIASRHDHGPGTDDRSVAYCHQRTDMGMRRDRRIFAYDCGRMDAGNAFRQRIQKRGESCKIRIGIVANDARQLCRISIFSRQDHGRCLAVFKLAAVFGIGQKGDLPRGSVLQRADLLNRVSASPITCPPKRAAISASR